MKLHLIARIEIIYANLRIVCTQERASTNFVRKAEDGSDGIMIIDKADVEKVFAEV